MSAGSGLPLPRSVVLVGLPGAGKSAVGRRLAVRMGVPFTDLDQAIEEAAGCTVEEVFERYGEPAFRDVERRVIARLLDEPPHVIATGGGAFMDPDTRALVAVKGISVWLRAELDMLVARTARRANRPLLKRGDPREILARLMAERHPAYARADLVVDSREGPPEEMAEFMQEVIQHFLRTRPAAPAGAVQQA